MTLYDADLYPVFLHCLSSAPRCSAHSSPVGSNLWIGRGMGPPLNRTVTSWYNNLRIPFVKSISATITGPRNLNVSNQCRAFMLIRGAVGVGIDVGSVVVPHGARMVLQTNYNVSLKPLDFYTLFSRPSGDGCLVMTTLVVHSGNTNFMEALPSLFCLSGCVW
jgi:hypothetical protein